MEVKWPVVQIVSRLLKEKSAVLHFWLARHICSHSPKKANGCCQMFYILLTVPMMFYRFSKRSFPSRLQNISIQSILRALLPLLFSFFLLIFHFLLMLFLMLIHFSIFHARILDTCMKLGFYLHNHHFGYRLPLLLTLTGPVKYKIYSYFHCKFRTNRFRGAISTQCGSQYSHVCPPPATTRTESSVTKNLINHIWDLQRILQSFFPQECSFCSVRCPQLWDLGTYLGKWTSFLYC